MIPADQASEIHASFAAAPPSKSSRTAEAVTPSGWSRANGGIPAFRSHISRSIGADILSPDGDRRVVLAVLDIQSHPTITPDTARTLQQGMTKPDGG